MGQYTISKNTSIDVQLESDYQDSGWTRSGGNAVHSSLNEGYFENFVFSTEIGQEYKITFTVSGMTTGLLRVIVGGVSFDITENGIHERTFTAIDTSGIRLWSDADVIVSPILVNRGEYGYNTFVFNPEGNFDTYISFTCDTMVKLLGSYYTFKNGELWKHNENEIRNSFYGEVHKSIVTFVLNPEPKVVKNLVNMKINGNRAWDLVDVFVLPYDGKPNGQKSRLTKNRFESLQGDFHATFLKDMSDPRFTDQVQALFEGADLQGKLVEITMEVGGGEEMRLVSIDFVYNNSNYTY